MVSASTQDTIRVMVTTENSTPVYSPTADSAKRMGRNAAAVVSEAMSSGTRSSLVAPMAAWMPSSPAAIRTMIDSEMTIALSTRSPSAMIRAASDIWSSWMSNTLIAHIVMIIVTALALGKALLDTGMAGYIAQTFVNLASGLPPPLILSAFLLLMTVMTNIVSNNAAAAIGTPIAISIAGQLGVPSEPFILAVLFGANMSFATPYGYQTNLLIMTAGGYKFGDFLRVGIPLTIIMWIGFSIALPLLYEL